MLEAVLWSRAHRPRPTPKRRERRAHFRELVQFDGSFHDWFEGRGERAGGRSCVMNMVGDATGTTLLRFGEPETIWAAADVLRAWIERYGVPRALYTDWKNVYKREPTRAEEAAGEDGHTHFGRTCAKLGIEIIAASTPQAKGRVERSNGTQQDRLVKKMRLRGIADDAAANAYVESTYLPTYNARYAAVPASPVDYHCRAIRRVGTGTCSVWSTSERSVRTSWYSSAGEHSSSTARRGAGCLRVPRSWCAKRRTVRCG
jgi:hypothetical protein